MFTIPVLKNKMLSSEFPSKLNYMIMIEGQPIEDICAVSQYSRVPHYFTAFSFGEAVLCLNHSLFFFATYCLCSSQEAHDTFPVLQLLLHFYLCICAVFLIVRKHIVLCVKGGEHLSHVVTVLLHKHSGWLLVCDLLEVKD